MMTNTPQEVAASLIEEGYPVEKYQKIQEHRRDRLIFFRRIGLQTAIDKELEIIAHGEAVLGLMKEAKKPE